MILRPIGTLIVVLASLGSLAQAPAPPETLDQSQIQALIREAAEKDVQNDKKQRDYTYVQREEEHQLNGNGAVNESATDRKKRIEKEEKDREEGREFVKEIADAYNFRMTGSETVDGRDSYVIDAEPRPGYEPHMKNAKFLPKFRFRVWVDKQEKQWVKLDIQCIDTVSVGLFLVRLHKGSNIQIQQTRINDEVWLPKFVNLKLDARVALLKGLSLSENVTYRDYKKFRTDTKITPLGEVQ
jgi:hypothetical protein